jgi:penicillin-binding protein 1C
MRGVFLRWWVLGSSALTMKRILLLSVIFLLGSIALLYGYAALTTESLPLSLSAHELNAPSEREKRLQGLIKATVLDRHGRYLAVTRDAAFNITTYTNLQELPSFLIQALLFSEDKRFYNHDGLDWIARSTALYQNIRAFSAMRGARTITEQVVSLLHKRPRSLLTRLREGIEARALERRFSKEEILEFYINQVPFARKRRGFQQAARLYFARDLTTLSHKELLALVVILRAPSAFDLPRGEKSVLLRLENLLSRMVAHRLISEAERSEILSLPLEVRPEEPLIHAEHFVRHVLSSTLRQGDVLPPVLKTSLDGVLQSRVESLLQMRINDLARKGVTDGAVLIVENVTGAIRAYVNGGASFGKEQGSQIDAIQSPRQPGSTLKPFVYAAAIERGWHGATMLRDEPLYEGVGAGVHDFKNYSRIFYGPIRLREALGNSLNIPAIHAIKFVQNGRFLEYLHALGFNTLTKDADYYGDGLVLGNGEVKLYELVQAYRVLAQRGVFTPLVWIDAPKVQISHAQFAQVSTPVFSPPTTSIISDILADPYARSREFGGSHSLLRFPVETAVKTGTSTDYRDAWALGYTDRYTVGVWLGDLERRSMHEVSGATGSVLVLRSVFRELYKSEPRSKLWRDKSLRRKAICAKTGELAHGSCARSEELFHESMVVKQPESRRLRSAQEHKNTIGTAKISFPTPGLLIARDPRIPDDRESIDLRIASLCPHADSVSWRVDGSQLGVSTAEHGRITWPLSVGRHTFQAACCRGIVCGVYSAEVAVRVR